MADEQNDRKVIIAILLWSTVLTMLAIGGIVKGSFDLSNLPVPEAEAEAETVDDDAEEDETDALNLLIRQAQATNPYRRPFAAANIVVSGLVLIGSFLLSWRRRLAQWWIKNAVAAKVLWIVAYTVSFVSHLQFSIPQLAPEGTDTVGVLREVVTLVVVLGLISVALHVIAAWRATRPDITRFIERSSARL